MSTMVPMYGFSGGGGKGATLTVNAPSGATVTVSKDGKSKTKVADTAGVAVFKGLSSGEWTLSITDGEQTAQKTVTITADYTTAITFFAATIHVTYPAGSTCTATDGVTTLTAPDTSGTWDCVVPNAGTWTFGYDGYAIDTVEITESGQEESITLGLYLFKSGVGVIVPIKYGSKTTNGITVATDKITLTYSSNAKAMSYIYNKNKIDITSYKTIKVRAKCTENNSENKWKGKLFASENDVILSDTLSKFSAYTFFTENSSVNVYSVDIASLTGDYYVGVQGAWKGELYDLWLE